MSVLNQPAPVQPERRIETLDFLRGVAICGILLMNIPYMGRLTERPAPDLPARWDLNWISWGIQDLFFEGTMRGLFELLFGAGMLLMLRSAEGENPQAAPFDVWARRCLALMFLGLVQWAVFLWPGEILWSYGICGLFLLAFRTARPRTLIIAGTLMLTVLSANYAMYSKSRAELLQASVPAAAAAAANKPLTPEQKKAIQAYETAREANHPSPASIASAKAERTHLSSLFQWSAGFWTQYNISALGWILLLEGIGTMLLGMALFRLGILTGAASRATYVWLMLIGYGGGLAIRIVALVLTARTGFDVDVSASAVSVAVFSGGSYNLGRILVTLGHVGALVAAFRSGWFGRAATVRALGRMALTTYSLQSILTSSLFYGLGYVGAFSFAELMGIAAAIWIVTAIFCRLWLRGFAMGPAEYVLRAIAYGRWSVPRNGAPALTPALSASAIPR
ncbi:DUF418 domain-containing protein [Sphingomonas sp. LB-2]|uniref:DUF418 domain-containing protein n=1 Tax=Sphingomonas caeni TaxID=2984949 RepID=UPI00222F4977|nr:DUF418 domain-containing protein [Sphingomonas caeni]MCW3848037.1 DUF418 domain-containing protein [Sphingomonas caeni]